jgi:hypothetical protein
VGNIVLAAPAHRSRRHRSPSISQIDSVTIEHEEKSGSRERDDVASLPVHGTDAALGGGVT